MRNLKRVLALALALVMMLGMMITASAASYSDADQIDANYAEAVDVLTGLGVFQGVGNNVFSAKTVLTRAQASALIYRVITADVTDKQVSLYAYPSFNDMAAGAWYTGYVTYAANGGYIKGYGNGVFGPDDAVTGVQVLAIMLRAAGYGQNGEFEGAAWKDNVLTTANDLKLLEGIAVQTLDNGATRELVAQLLFNCLTKATMVTYTPALGYIPVNLTQLTGIQTLGVKNFTLAKHTGYVTYKDAKTGMILTEKGKTYAVADQDIFDAGRYGHVWTSGEKAKAITGVYYDDTLLATKFDAKGLDAKASGSWTNDAKTNTNYVAGTTADTLYFLNGKQVAAKDLSLKKGTEVKLYSIDGKGNIDTVVVIDPTVDVMTADYLTKNNQVKIQGKTFAASKVSGYEDLVKGDVFTYVDMEDGVRYYEELTAIEGQKTVYTQPAKGSAYITFDGADYEKSALTGTTDNADLFTKTKTTFDKDAYVYLDRGGYVVYTSWTAAAKTEYGMIIDTYSVVNDAHNGVDYYANILTVDGEETGYVPVNVNASWTAAAFTNVLSPALKHKTHTNDAIADLIDLGILVKYSVKDGVYTLTDANCTYTDNRSLAKLTEDYKAGAATAKIGYNEGTASKYAIDDNSIVFYYWCEEISANKATAHYGVNVGKFNTDTNADGIPSYAAGDTDVGYLDAGKSNLLVAAVFNGMTMAEYDQYAYIYAFTKETTTGSKLDIYTYYGVNANGEVVEFSAYKDVTGPNGNDVVGSVVWFIERQDGYAEFGWADYREAALAKVGTGNTVMVRYEGANTDWDTFMNSADVYDLTSTKGLKVGDTVSNYDFYWDKTVKSIIVYSYDETTKEEVVETAFVLDETVEYVTFDVKYNTVTDEWFLPAGKYILADLYNEANVHVNGAAASKVEIEAKQDAVYNIVFHNDATAATVTAATGTLSADGKTLTVPYGTTLSAALVNVTGGTAAIDGKTITVTGNAETCGCKVVTTITVVVTPAAYAAELSIENDELTATLSTDAALDDTKVVFIRKNNGVDNIVGTTTAVTGTTANITISETGSYKVVVYKGADVICESAWLDVQTITVPMTDAEMIQAAGAYLAAKYPHTGDSIPYDTTRTGADAWASIAATLTTDLDAADYADVTVTAFSAAGSTLTITLEVNGTTGTYTWTQTAG